MSVLETLDVFDDWRGISVTVYPLPVSTRASREHRVSNEATAVEQLHRALEGLPRVDYTVGGPTRLHFALVRYEGRAGPTERPISRGPHAARDLRHVLEAAIKEQDDPH